MAPFDLARFEAFCSRLRIDSKEFGRIPLKWIGTQRYFVQEVAAGLANGIHTFVVLKGRQIGISTIALALDLYWLFKHPGMQAAIVTDSDENRELFRSYVDQYIDSLPGKYRPRTDKHNRAQLIMGNNSRMVYMVAGTRKKGDLGRAKAVNYLHATECSSWGDEEGFSSLMNTLAQQNPHRLYIFESTARGFNAFYQQWEIAKQSRLQKSIFIGWWRNELYRKDRASVEFNTYWDGEPTSDERVWIREVFEQYHINITPEQLVWWRWYVDEQMKGDEQAALQEMPPTEEYAFQLSGSKFFSSERVNNAMQFAIKQEAVFFRYKFGLNFEDTEFIQTNEDNAEVVIWELPHERGVSSLGCDPAYGSSEWADEFAGQLLRCYADRVVQAAEIGATHWTEQQYAWVIAHLAGWYGQCMLTVEMQGPGGTVYNELNNLRGKVAALPSGDPRAGAFDVIGRIRDYLWRRQDSLSGNFALQWQTNVREKVRMMTTLRSYFEREMVQLNSPWCVQQFRNIHRNGDRIGGEGRAKDDRVIALAIAVIAWNDWLLRELEANGRTFVAEQRPMQTIRQLTPLENNVMQYLKRAGIKMTGMIQ